jgi:hypothetical protein
VQTDGTLALTPTTAPSSLYVAATAIFGVMPGLKAAGNSQSFSVTVSDVVFTGSPANCTPSITTASGSLVPCTSYTANVAWSVPLSAFSAQVPAGTNLGIKSPATVPLRQCGTLTQVPKTQSATFTTIPTQGMTNLSSVLVVDVTYTYQPVFTTAFAGRVFSAPITFTHTSMLPPRLTPSSPPTYIVYVTSTTTDASAPAWTATSGGVCTGYI